MDQLFVTTIFIFVAVQPKPARFIATRCAASSMLISAHLVCCRNAAIRRDPRPARSKTCAIQDLRDPRPARSKTCAIQDLRALVAAEPRAGAGEGRRPRSALASRTARALECCPIMMGYGFRGRPRTASAMFGNGSWARPLPNSIAVPTRWTRANSGIVRWRPKSGCYL
jgi:hypothetical protein